MLFDDAIEAIAHIIRDSLHDSLTHEQCKVLAHYSISIGQEHIKTIVYNPAFTMDMLVGSGLIKAEVINDDPSA